MLLEKQGNARGGPRDYLKLNCLFKETQDIMCIGLILFEIGVLYSRDLPLLNCRTKTKPLRWYSSYQMTKKAWLTLKIRCDEGNFWPVEVV